MKNNPAGGGAVQTERFLTGCGFFVFGAGALWALFFVAMNMDEAGIYHVLACFDYPFAPLHVFREACAGQDDLTALFGLHIARSQFYVGLLHSVLYAPLYFIFHAPWGQYVFGLCFFIAFAFLLSRMTAKPLLSFALFLAFFPFVFQFIHDTGPVKFAMLAFPLSAILFRKIIRSPPPVCHGYAAVLALLLVCAVEDKAFFLYLLPSLALFVPACAMEGDKPEEFLAAAGKARPALLTALGLALAGLLLLLLSVNTGGHSYIAWLTDMVVSRPPPAEGWFVSTNDYTLFWPGYAHYLYHLSRDSVATGVFKFVTLAFFAFCIAAAVRAQFLSVYPQARLILLMLSFAATPLVFLVFGNAWAGHHYVFMWVPLLLIFADLVARLSPGPALAAGAFFLLLNLASVVNLTQQEPREWNAPDRAAVLQFFADEALAGRSIVNFTSWGGYYIQSLYGPKNQLVTYTEPYESAANRTVPLSSESARALLDLARATGRKIYTVCIGNRLCNKTALETAFDNRVTFEDALPGLPVWHVFAATPRKP